MTLKPSRTGRLVVATVTFALCATTLLAQSRGRLRFDDVDLNHDGVITRDEWRGSDRDFRSYDLNRDGVLSRSEFSNARRLADDQARPTDQTRSADQIRGNDQTRATGQTRATDPYQSNHPTSRAFEAGRQRGLEEGRQAGQEDSYRHSWDLDGQQELETSDSGYRSDFGPLEEFQAGYREAFITAYRTAFGPTAPRHGEAYRAGEARGLADGREAGREDASRSHWDLEGQHELLLADAGYRGELGSRSEYEEGYRAGFRQGYSDRFGQR
jgi:hypothetical protein